MTAPPKPKRPENYYRPRAELVERRAKALTMRNAGATYERIAQQLGISTACARADIVRAVKESCRAPVEQLLDRQRAILNDLIRTNYPLAMDKTQPRCFEAQAKILEALAHEAKLCGLYAPARVQVGISEEEFGRQAAELLKVTGPGPLLELVRAAPTVEAEVVEEEPWSNL